MQDIWRIAFFLIIGAADLCALFLLPKIEPVWLDVSGRILGMFMTHLIVIMLIREIVPKPPLGSVRIGKGSAYLKWLLASGLAQVINCRLFAGPFNMFHFSRYLYLRAQGTKLAFDATIHPSVSISAPSLLTVDRGAQLEAGVSIINIAHAMGRVRIGEISIGEGVLVGAKVQLMTGASLGPNARIGPSAYIGPDVHVGLGTKIGEGAVLAAGVDLGSYVRVGAGAVIAEGASIGENAKIRAGSVIPPSTRIRAGEVWQGLPARAVFRDNRSADVETPSES